MMQMTSSGTGVLNVRPQNCIESFFKLFIFLGMDQYNFQDVVKKKSFIVAKADVSEVIPLSVTHFLVVFNGTDHKERAMIVTDLPDNFRDLIKVKSTSIFNFYWHLAKNIHWFLAPIATVLMVLAATIFILLLRSHSDNLVSSGLAEVSDQCSVDCVRSVLEQSYVYLLMLATDAILVVSPLVFAALAWIKMRSIYLRRFFIFQASLMLFFGASIVKQHHESQEYKFMAESIAAKHEVMKINYLHLLMTPFISGEEDRSIAAEKEVKLKVEEIQ